MNFQIRIVFDDEAAAWSKRDAAIERLEALPVQRGVMVDTSPSLPVVAVCDVELRACIALGRVRAHEGHAGFGKVIRTEETQAVGERLLVDPVGADRGGQAARDLSDRLRLAGVQPPDERGVNGSDRESQRASGSLLHASAITRSSP